MSPLPLQSWMNALWYEGRARALSRALLPLSALYGWGYDLKKALTTPKRGALPTLVIGSLTLGGSGKTPLTLYLAEALASRLHPVRLGVLSRGYLGSLKTPNIVSPTDSPAKVGDEPLMLRQALSQDILVAVARQRLSGIEYLKTQGAGLVICDDGWQHQALSPDIRLCVIDAHRGFGNERLLPAGPLRSRLSELKDADVIVLKSPTPASTQLLGRIRAFSSAPIFEMRFRSEWIDLHTGRNATPPPAHYGAFAGIASPGSFQSALEAQGLSFSFEAFSDHAPFRSEASLPPKPWLMTEKDAVKCRRFVKAPKEAFFLKQRALFGEEFVSFLCTLVAPLIALPKPQDRPSG